VLPPTEEAVMVTRPTEGTSAPSPSISEAEVVLMSIEAQLWSLDRTPETTSTIEQIEQIVTNIREGLRSASG
jgi:hypothetical protein